MTAYDSEKHRRQSMRLRDYDYSCAGAYFVTICTRERRNFFGEIAHGCIQPSRAGEVASAAWKELPNRFVTVALDEFIVMPNHIHGLILLAKARDASKRRETPLGEVVRTFKAVTARRLRLAGPADFGWQRNYYEHIVRTDGALARIRQYIAANPAARPHDPDQE
jgi:putative transposase